ncbi:MAG: inorganic phosphate transporter [Cyclobacteriaceae bacterium]|nr:inorganic phosphate transporter [Cyclobacteriaceae bacterium]
MSSIFIFIIVLMFLLAIADLIVGVSNDAVNFLNSAIGAKAGTMRNIFIIACIGIMFGAIFSSGMMEVARSGIFNPQFFTIEEIMFLFAAVMLTDIILLDFYNSIALPTSTTVSIVFERLGSAIAISFFSIVNKGEAVSEWGNYINGSRAIIIILGIFLSVVIAFILGWLVQYVARLIISFDLNRASRSFGSVFGAASITLIVIFIILKGLQGIPFISGDQLQQLRSHVGMISLATLALTFILFQVFARRFGFNVYRFITLFGTFALAMAFASNDLVNFIGVPIASYDSFVHWRQFGAGSSDYMMGVLAEPVQSNPLFLLGAGAIMTLTLWFSKKARSVVQTSVNLGRQAEGFERFQGNDLARGLVKSISAIGRTITNLLPQQSINYINSKFTSQESDRLVNDKNKPAFDMVRASVNLTVAAGIILLATSFKLPLSTTFVSFMVLMGTSLADRAWGSGSAVYRVSGVLTVIGGWLLTAVIALIISMIFASLLINFKVYALIGLVMFAFLLIARNLVSYRKIEKMEKSITSTDHIMKLENVSVQSDVIKKIQAILTDMDNVYTRIITAFINKNGKELSKLKSDIGDIKFFTELNKIEVTRQAQGITGEVNLNVKIFMIVYDLQESIFHAMEEIIKVCEKHVKNLHQDHTDEQIATFKEVEENLSQYIREILAALNQEKLSSENFKELKARRKSLIHKIEDNISDQLTLANKKRISSKNSQLILTVLFSTKNLIVRSGRFVKLVHLIKSKEVSEHMLDNIVEGI